MSAMFSSKIELSIVRFARFAINVAEFVPMVPLLDLKRVSLVTKTSESSIVMTDLSVVMPSKCDSVMIE